MKLTKLLFLFLFLFKFGLAFGQVTERSLPKEWDGIVYGAKFSDRFLPMHRGQYSANIWGGSNVANRYVDNGIEDNTRSYWGGNIIQDKDGLYHLFVCGWREDSPKGHHEWHNSIVYRATSKNLHGSYVIQDTIGKGHNPEAFISKEGKYVVYVIGGKYESDKIDGPWEYGEFKFDGRDRHIIEGLSNLTFTKRQDKSFLMVCRGGGGWFSKTGLTTYKQVSDRSLYPGVDGEFEDPVVWRDSVQYHLVVNDWKGRIAYYQRSKDGVNWVTDPGLAYTPSVAYHWSGYLEDWFKIERIKVFQDEYGRAIQANFAAIDSFKDHDLPNDNHSSKNMMIPLNPGLLLSMVDEKMPTSKTQTIRVKVMAENGFNPHTDIDLASLRFGANTEVNFGKGCKLRESIKDGKDLILVFDAKGHGLTKDEFAPKLLGAKRDGSLLYGYVKAPWINYITPILSAKKPVVSANKSGTDLKIEVENFGQVIANSGTLKITAFLDGVKKMDESVTLKSKIKPFESQVVSLKSKHKFSKNSNYDFVIELVNEENELSVFEFTERF